MTVVLRLIREPEIQQHREALCVWLDANGIDPRRVVPCWLSIERDDNDTSVIRYRQYKTTTDGQRLVDPDHDQQAWSEERTTPLLMELDLTPAKTLTAGAGT